VSAPGRVARAGALADLEAEAFEKRADRRVAADYEGVRVKLTRFPRERPGKLSSRNERFIFLF